jgi:hypothetical protein
MARVIIVTAADANYAPLAEQLLASLASAPESRGVAIGFLDVGLESAQRARFAAAGASVVEPGWDYDFTGYAEKPPGHMRALTARPHLRRYFPGYDFYLHMDADTWLQDWRAIELYLSAAQERGFAIAPELDRSYSAVVSGMFENDLKLRIYRRYFSEETTRQLVNLPLLNAGVFAAAASAPHWQAWHELLSRAYGELCRVAAQEGFAVYYAEQFCLNAAVRSLPEPAALLPAWCNWMCHRALPRCSEDGTVLYEPNPPYRKLGIVHLTSDTMNGRWELRDLAGKAQTRSLRYRGD